MTSSLLQNVAKAAGERVAGVGPGPVRAFVAAAITGTAAAVVTYKALRSGSDSDD
jgi:hypothetical protein